MCPLAPNGKRALGVTSVNPKAMSPLAPNGKRALRVTSVNPKALSPLAPQGKRAFRVTSPPACPPYWRLNARSLWLAQTFLFFFWRLTPRARTSGITEFVPLPFVHMEAPVYLKDSKGSMHMASTCFLLSMTLLSMTRLCWANLTLPMFALKKGTLCTYEKGQLPKELSNGMTGCLFGAQLILVSTFSEGVFYKALQSFDIS
eukprot:68616-Pelagomonas_calceolata.AAC.1